ncbi:hypothetical protein BDF22DRAFT_677496 [Syncephalis plumigaleata]|nr:hypothetical protein BDF22DRAFT_677496 [Syncephalis plumigaleata]
MTSSAVAYNGQGEPIHPVGAAVVSTAAMPTHVTLVEESMHPEAAWSSPEKVIAQQLAWEEETVAELKRISDSQAIYAETKPFMSLPAMGQPVASWADTPGCQEMVNPLDSLVDPNAAIYPTNEVASVVTATATAATAPTAVVADTNNEASANRAEDIEQDNSRTLWIGNFFNETVSDEELREFLGPCAKGVSHIKFMFDRKTGRQRPFCFVEFTSEAYLAEALELSGKKLKSADVKINRAGHKESSKRVDETGTLAA